MVLFTVLEGIISKCSSGICASEVSIKLTATGIVPLDPRLASIADRDVTGSHIGCCQLNITLLRFPLKGPLKTSIWEFDVAAVERVFPFFLAHILPRSVSPTLHPGPRIVETIQSSTDLELIEGMTYQRKRFSESLAPVSELCFVVGADCVWSLFV